jgi:DNA-binding response OmpR family regulator
MALRAKKHFVLIDDDRLFGLAMSEYAKSTGMTLDYFESLSELGFVGKLGAYDAAILDYHLADMKGVEIAQYLESLFGGIPTVVISSDPAAESVPMPGCVRLFLQKSTGVAGIMSAVDAVV